MNKLILLLIIVLLSGCISRYNTPPTRYVDDNATGEHVELIASMTNSIKWGAPVELSIVLTNLGSRPVQFGIKSPYSDCRIEVYNSHGQPARVSEFGRHMLAQNVFATFKRPTQMEVNGPVYAWTGRSWVTGWLGVAGGKPETEDRSGLRWPTLSILNSARYEWKVDLSKCYELKPGRYAVYVYYEYRASMTPKVQPLHFKIRK